MMTNLSSEVTTRAAMVVDWASVAVLLGAWTSVLPPIATFLTIVWLSIRIYESLSTRWRRRRKTPCPPDCGGVR